MASDEYPSPSPLAFQITGGPFGGHDGSNPVSLEIPSRFGPRHCGQSAAAAARHIEKRIKPRFTFGSLVEYCSRMPDPNNFDGRRIGKYRLTSKIGEGGMGDVYLAERESEFRQRVAVKLIRSGTANLEVIRRFMIERQTLAALNHPQIVRLIDGGATEEDNLPYLVVDYIEGEPIDEYCDARHLSVTDRLQLFVGVCGAVHYAHQNLIVHCDLKPSNILVTKDGVPMLLDFGIAKLLDPASMGISANVAKTRMRAFTPDYASPEQLRGEPVTTATDIYALGVILYELLTGHSPYRVTADGALADWIKSVCEEDAEPPSTIIHRTREVTGDDEKTRMITPEEVSRSREGDPQALQQRLEGDLDAIVLKSLRKQPADRYGSVDQLAEDIRRHLSGRPVLARRSSSAYVARKFFARHRIAVGAAALVLLSVIAGLAATLWEARVAARRFEDVRQLAHAFLFDVYDSVEFLPGSTSARELIAKTGTEYLDRLAKDRAGDATLEAELAEGYTKIGDVEGNQYNASRGNVAKSIANYEKALPLAEAAVKRAPHDRRARRILGTVHLNLASTLPFTGKGADGLAHVKKSEEIFRALWAEKPDDIEARLDLARAYDQEGDIQGGARAINLGHTAEAEKAYQQALDLIPELPPSHPQAARAVRTRAVVIVHLGDMQYHGAHLPDALSRYQVALQTVETMAQADPNSTRLLDIEAVILNKIGSLHTDLRQNDAAADAYRRTLDIQERTLRVDPNNERARTGVFITEKNLGDLNYYNLNNMGAALIAYRRAADLLESMSAADPANMINRQNLSEILTCVASCLLATGKPDEARREARRGLDIARQVADHPGATSEQVYNYAYLGINIDPADLRNPLELLPYAKKAVAMTGEKEPFSLHTLAQIYAAENQFAQAIQVEEKADALFPPVEPGKPKPNAQETVEQFLEKCRAQLKKRGG